MLFCGNIGLFFKSASADLDEVYELSIIYWAFSECIGLFCANIGLFCAYIGLFCRLFRGYIGLICRYIGLFCGYIEPCCGYTGLFTHMFRRHNTYAPCSLRMPITFEDGAFLQVYRALLSAKEAHIFERHNTYAPCSLRIPITFEHRALLRVYRALFIRKRDPHV